MTNLIAESTLLGGIIDFLEDIDGLHAYPFPVPGMVTPFCIPLLRAEYSAHYEGTSGPWTGSLLVMTKFGDGTSGGYELLDYTSPTGAKSIHAAVLTDTTMGGIAGNVRITGPEDDISLVDGPGGAKYYARRLGIEVYT